MDKQLISKTAVRQVLRDYWRQYKKYPWLTTLVALMPTIGNIFIIYVPPLIIAQIINIFIETGEITLTTVLGHIGLFAGLWFFGELLWRLGVHFLVDLEAKGMGNLAKEAFKRLIARDYTFFANNFVGSLTRKTLSFSKSFEGFTDILVFNAVSNFLPIIFAVIILWRYSFWIPILLVFLLMVVVLIAIPIIRRRAHLVVLRHESHSKWTGRLSDAITNIMAVKSFAHENKEQNTYKTHVDDFVFKFRKAANYQNLRLDTVLSPFYVITNVIGLIAAIYFAMKFGLEAGVIIVVFSYYSSITRLFWNINHIYRTIENNISEAAEFTQLFIEPPEIVDKINATSLKIKKADIRFNEVGFRYSDDQSGVNFLNNFNLEIKPHERVGLVGPSGGGKTTITKLILRFIDLESGQILIDGQDISQVTQKSLRENIAYVPQEPLLFHRSLFENIAYGKEATPEEVIHAAKLAYADEFIERLPKGYETTVGERGIKLSGGQRQRVAIARAILKNAPILVLDEATSSLDSESEKYIQKGFWELMKGKTTLVIAHRLSTIKHLDRIIVLDQGKIIQDGTHDELIKQKRGLYAKLWAHQSGEFLPDKV